jgi:putative DNA primase/helicase
MFLNSLPKWDGVDRLEELSNTLEKVGATTLEKELKLLYIKKWCVGLIAGLHNNEYDNIYNENILILQGQQNKGKTRWCNKLLPKEYSEFFLSKNIQLKDKDDLIFLSTKFIIYMDEGISLKRNDIKEIKEITSKSTYSLRKAYGYNNETYVRYSSFVSTTNDEFILSDDTGNRRYWIIQVDNVNHNHSIDMNQLWAQALDLYNSGCKWYLDDEELVKINEHNTLFEIENPIEYFLDLYIEKDTNYNLSATEIVDYIVKKMNDDKRYKPEYFNPMGIGRALIKLGYKKKVVRINNNTKNSYNVRYKEYRLKGDNLDIKKENIFNMN